MDEVLDSGRVLPGHSIWVWMDGRRANHLQHGWIDMTFLQRRNRTQAWASLNQKQLLAYSKYL